MKPGQLLSQGSFPPNQKDRPPAPVSPPEISVSQLFEAQAEQTPDASAVVFEGQHLTYRELNRRVNTLAHHLRRLGVGPETLVGLCVQRSLDCIVGMMGILKSGGAYVPIDPGYPQERIHIIVKSSHLRFLVTQRALFHRFPRYDAKVIGLDGLVEQPGDGHNPTQVTHSEHLAYVIFTSGSTGHPKGVLIPHRALVNHTRTMMKHYALGPRDRVLQFASLSFDVAGEEIFPSLASGATVVFRSGSVKTSLGEFERFAQQENLSVVNLPSPYWHEWVSHLERRGHGIPPSLRLVIVGSEQTFTDALEVWNKIVSDHVRWCHAYGPTEATITATTFEPSHTHVPSASPSVPIGKPIANTDMYLLDDHLEQVPVGLTGEIYIGGLGLARGYLHVPELTAERFIPDPFASHGGGVLYRTRDLGRFGSDGNLEFMGRKDRQVKFRGFRIELGEIEAAIRSYPAAQDVVVLSVVEEREATGLVAYLVCESGPLSTMRQLRDFLRSSLPDYMVPTHFTFLDVIPRTAHGKVDRQALPPVGEGDRSSGTPLLAPSNDVEAKLAEIWRAVLGIEHIGVHDDFFEIGGHSLKAMQVLTRVWEWLGKELVQVSLFEAPTIATLAHAIEAANGETDGKAPFDLIKMPRPTHIPLSFAQEQVWFLNELAQGTVAYNSSFAIRLKGNLNVLALEKTLSEIVRRHEILRTTFHEQDGQPIQVIHPPSPIGLPLVDLREVVPERRENHVQELMIQESRTPFDIERLPLVRWTLIILGEHEWVLLQVEHHFVHDGWSFAVLLEEMTRFYREFSGGGPSGLSEIPIQFADFVLWQRQETQGKRFERQMDYWKHTLSGELSPLALPADYPRPNTNTYQGAEVRLDLSPKLSESLRALARQEHATLFMTMVAGFFTLLYRYSGQTDICVGTGVANRRVKETEGLIGMILNTIVLRSHLSGNPPFREYLAQVKRVTQEAYQHQDVPFEKIVEVLRPDRDLRMNPLFQAMFAFHDNPVPVMEFPGLTGSVEYLHNHTAKFDLNVIVVPRVEQCVGMSEAHAEQAERGISIYWEYSTDLFEAETATRMAHHYRQILESIVADLDQRLSTLPLLSDQEEKRLLVEWNQTTTLALAERCMHELFEAQVVQTPEAVAVVWGEEQITYRELNTRANQLAHYLQRQGVGPEVRVGVWMDRCPDLLVSLLAVLKAGGAYVPIDPSYPTDRVEYMLADADVSVILTSTHKSQTLPVYAGQVIFLDWETLLKESGESLKTETRPENLAYVLYTSGSTGTPKGVMITHGSVLSFLYWANSVFSQEDLSGVVAATSISFDLSVFEIFVPLSWGGTVLIAEDALNLMELPALDRVTLVNTVPSAIQELVKHVVPPSLRMVNLAGEPLPTSLVETIYADWGVETVHDLYGPSETTTYATFAVRPSIGKASIGRPLSTIMLYVMDRYHNLVPLGVSGELYISGPQVARGYLHRPSLTAERFLPHGFNVERGARMYRTGDVGRYFPDGTIDFLGRVDRQIKLRGYRIELGEIEVVLRQLPEVEDAVVLIREDDQGMNQLVAYLVLTWEGSVTSTQMRTMLKTRLPEYMVPSIFVVLENLPLTPNGKIDRGALAMLEEGSVHPNTPCVAPRSPMEEVVAQIWKDVLKVEEVGIHDNFFDLGGHSLTATFVVSRILKILDIKVPVKTVFEAPTVAGLSEMLEQEGQFNRT